MFTMLITYVVNVSGKLDFYLIFIKLEKNLILLFIWPILYFNESNYNVQIYI